MTNRNKPFDAADFAFQATFVVARDRRRNNRTFLKVSKVRDGYRCAGNRQRIQTVFGVEPANDDFDVLPWHRLFARKLFKRQYALIGSAQVDENAVGMNFDDLTVNALAVFERFFAIGHPRRAAEQFVNVGRREFGIQFGLQIIRQILSKTWHGDFDSWRFWRRVATGDTGGFDFVFLFLWCRRLVNGLGKQLFGRNCRRSRFGDAQPSGSQWTTFSSRLRQRCR